jgi:MFS family permease
MLASICGLWAGTVYVPAAITAVAEAGGRGGAQAAQLASRGIMLVSFATILGCLAMPWLAERLGRRGALAVFFTLMMVFIALTFGKVFYLGAVALPWFFGCLFFLGLGGANFSVYTLGCPSNTPRNAGPAHSRFPPRSPDSAVLESPFWWERGSAISARWELRSR